MITVSVLAVLGAATSTTIFDFDLDSDDDNDAISELVEPDFQYAAENQFRTALLYAAIRGTQKPTDGKINGNTGGHQSLFKPKQRAVLHNPMSHCYRVMLALKLLKQRLCMCCVHWHKRMHILPQLLRHLLTLISR